ncbi:MAG: DUF4041 domain-containing protein [Clostridium tyrobutyricum]|jgi:hypothetical protein|uniref:DUF4041 domain-containing protein n=1 Tax=Clostridium tyrobutyricum TaxID=1519 RepID=UPI00242F6B5B|nr:DUF4041 domain-containing protein [Clostridium tyrobutyricum]MCH4199229.1 DUF4041 domain-containing protein [Clostridium tyrobutyricum]MCH4236561.1 DUF4041 domain-containing protein [Clostridium tyrobutyricum]MCH4258123.1 DUF4041 domain-containing protein [Clostridium tyrobutyricum]MCI1239162.1 DUF4041 domain-containing protein [Clostridium tyrobutyricum]MCI1651366.1 DUF4041 domain-containing protein [Clostridium tyrobutyricum]
MKKKWYLQTWFIMVIFAFWFFIIPGIIGIVLLILSVKQDKLIKEEQKSLSLQIEKLKSESLDAKKEDLGKINIQINNSKEKLKNINGELNNITEMLHKNKNESIKFSSENESLLEQNNELMTKINEQQEIINKNAESINLAKELIAKKEKIEKELKEKQEELSIKREKISHELEEKQKELIVLDDELLFQSVGLYTPQYNLTSSTAYKAKLNEIRDSQKQMVKNKTAVSFYDGWVVEDSISKGKAMTNGNIKLILRSFNNECEATISKVKFSNVESMKKRINKSFETLNKLGERMKVSIEPEYLNLKIEELELAYEYEVKKQEEKEEQLEIRERMREEAKALKEIENAKKKIEKEEHHFQNAIKDINEQLSIAKQDEKSKLLDKLNALTLSLNQLGKDKEDIANREKNTRAGYVYIISNIGSFGENIYKIGMTRRLNPNERVRELGDASVPFKFDVHAMIFSEDAPSLENALHKKFNDRRVNRINARKEFFKVSLKEIEEEVKKNFNAVVEFTKIAEAAEYRQSLKIEHDINSSSIAS